jgi:hypothetical protein
VSCLSLIAQRGHHVVVAGGYTDEGIAIAVAVDVRNKGRRSPSAAMTAQIGRAAALSLSATLF